MTHTKNYYRIVLCSILFGLALLLCTQKSIVASADTQVKEGRGYYIDDEAGLITDESSMETIVNNCKTIYSNYDTEVFILTKNSIPGNRKHYLEITADAHEVTDAVLLLINMDSNNRGYEIQGYGSAEFALDDKRIESVLDRMYPDMVDGNYTDAIFTFIGSVNSACQSFDYQDYEENPQHYVPHGETDYRKGIYNPWSQLFFAIVIAVIIVIIMVANSGGKVTVDQNTYLDRTDSRILARYDHYIRTTTTKRRKPSDSSSSGGHSSGGGRSSGGRSHSGGGRSF